MAHMQTSTTWIWKHIQYIKFRLVRFIGYFIGLIILPFLLPLFFYIAKIVIHCLLFGNLLIGLIGLIKLIGLIRLIMLIKVFSRNVVVFPLSTLSTCLRAGMLYQLYHPAII